MSYNIETSLNPNKLTTVNLTKEESAEVKNPYYIEYAPKYKLWEDVAEGETNIEGKKEYLKQHSYESNKQYEIRLWLSTYRNHAKPIMDVFTSTIWRKKPNRSLILDSLKEYIPNVNRQGLSSDSFFKDISNIAAKTGICFVLVDSTKLPPEYKGKKSTSKRDAQRLSLRPYFVKVRAENLIDWSFTKNKDTGVDELKYIVIKEEVQLPKEPFMEHKTQVQYKVWTQNEWYIKIDNEKEGLITIDQGIHNLGRVPIVPCYFDRISEMVGKSAIADISSLCLRAYRIGTVLDKSLYDTAYPIIHFKGFKTEELDGFFKTSSNGLTSGDYMADVKYVEPQGRSFAELRQNIKDDENAIKEIALRMVRADSKAVQSAESKRIDNLQLLSQISLFAQNIESCEKECWQLALMWMNLPTEKISIEYNLDFDVKEASGELIRAYLDLAQDEVISKEALVDILSNKEILPVDFDYADDFIKIRNQNRYDSTFDNSPNSTENIAEMLSKNNKTKIDTDKEQLIKDND